MIISIKNKALRLLWEDGDARKLPADLLDKIARVLEIIDSSEKLPDDFIAFRNLDLHKLVGDLKGYWSVKINKNFRIIFKFENGNAYNLDFIDYH